MDTHIDQLSVFLPVYNEEGLIKDVVVSVKEVLQKVARECELIIVNDGSTDSTGKIVESLAGADRRIRVISHRTNEGYAGALKSGFYGARYNWIAFIDSDGQFDFSEITSFIAKQRETGADAVIGYYKKRKVSFVKILTSKLWEFSVFILCGLKVRDIDCGFKMISKKVIDTIPKLESNSAFLSSELLIKAKNSGFKIVEIPVTHFPRVKGKATGRRLKVIVKSFADLFRLWKKIRLVS